MLETPKETIAYLERQIRIFKDALRKGLFCPKECKYWCPQRGTEVGPDWRLTFCDKYKRDLREEVIAGEGFSIRLDVCWADVHK